MLVRSTLPAMIPDGAAGGPALGPGVAAVDWAPAGPAGAVGAPLTCAVATEPPPGPLGRPMIVAVATIPVVTSTAASTNPRPRSEPITDAGRRLAQPRRVP